MSPGLNQNSERYVEGRDIAVVVAFEADAAGMPVVTVMNI